jgi:hypothetical protein
MEIHKPHPWQGWREFLKEYGIVVLGVLTALALEQAVESWRSHQTLNLLRASLGQELADDRARWELLRQQDDCMERRVKDLIVWTSTAPPGRTHDGVPSVMLPSLHASAWELARANPAFPHMPVREQIQYSSLYDALANQQRYTAEEQQRWHEIDGLVTLSADPQQRAFLVRGLSTALGYQKRRQQSYAYIFRHFDALHIRPETSGLADLQSLRCDR